jgi:hypothetical protein
MAVKDLKNKKSPLAPINEEITNAVLTNTYKPPKETTIILNPSILLGGITLLMGLYFIYSDIKNSNFGIKFWINVTMTLCCLIYAAREFRRAQRD